MRKLVYLILVLISINCKKNDSKENILDKGNSVTTFNYKDKSGLQRHIHKSKHYSLYSVRKEAHISVELFKSINDYKIVFKSNKNNVLLSSNFKTNHLISKTIFNCYSLDIEGKEDGGNIFILRSKKNDIYIKSWKELNLNIIALKKEESCQDDGP